MTDQRRTPPTPAGRRILGSLRSENGTGIVRIEERFDTDVDELWSALTDLGRVARWYGQVEGDLRPGGEFRLHVESSQWDGSGRVEACDPPRRLVITTRESDQSWRQGDGAEPSGHVIEATVTVDGDRTRLVIEVRGLPLETIAFYGVGWQLRTEGLAAYLAGRERDDSEARWADLLPAYQGLAAALI